MAEYYQVMVLDRCEIDDATFEKIVNSRKFKTYIRYADFSYNKLTEKSLEALCLAKPEKLRFINLVGNQVEDPRESGGYDQGNLILNGVWLSALGAELEKKHGYQPWLHHLSLLGNEAPLIDDVIETKVKKRVN